MVRRLRGTSMVEYVVLVVLIVGLVGGALLALGSTIYIRLQNVYVNIGS